MHITESRQSVSVYNTHWTSSHSSRLYCKCLFTFPSFWSEEQSSIYTMNFKAQEKLIQLLALSQTYV